VARVIHEFNRRVLARESQSSQAKARQAQVSQNVASASDAQSGSVR